jgi:hypothetical protein
MKLYELLEKRAAAGERYAAATGELHDVLIELAAPDFAAHRKTSLLAARDSQIRRLPTPRRGTLAHPIFAPIDPAICWRDETKARRDELLNSIEEIAR